MTKELTLEDLAQHSGLPLRTLRFYIQEGILQGPDTHGKFSRYSQQHLDRLEVIQRLKNLRLPLQEIRHLLNNMTEEESSQLRQFQDVINQDIFKIKTIQSKKPAISDQGSSALEYIHDLERGRKNIRSAFDDSFNGPPLVNHSRSVPSSKGMIFSQDQPIDDQETWRRIVLDEGIELNIREPGNIDEEQKVRKLIVFARKLFGNQSK
jgi:DNA-binding transcriptional MerR regulator